MAMKLDPGRPADREALRQMVAGVLARHPERGYPCPACGQPGLLELKTCLECGQPLLPVAAPGASPPTTAPPPVPPAAASPSPAPPPITPGPPPPPARSHAGRWMILGAVVALGAAVGFDLFLSHVQRLGQAYQQLNRDAQALSQHTPPSASPASSPSPEPQAVPAAVRGYANIISGHVSALSHQAEFPAILVGPSGQRVAVTVMIDTGNGSYDAVVPRVAQAAGLRVIGSVPEQGAVGPIEDEPLYQGFTLIPQGHFWKGTPGATLSASPVIAIPNTINGATVNLGQATLGHDAQFVEANGDWWFGWNSTTYIPPTTPPTLAPPTTPPAPAPAPRYPRLAGPNFNQPPADNVIEQAWKAGHLVPYSTSPPPPGWQTHLPPADDNSGWEYLISAPGYPACPPEFEHHWIWVYEPPVTALHQTAGTWAMGPGQPPMGPMSSLPRWCIPATAAWWKH